MQSKRAKKVEKRGKKKLSASSRAAEMTSGARYIKLPEGARFFTPKTVGEEIIVDVVPYVTSKTSKLFLKNDGVPGDEAFCRDYFVHRFCIGPAKESAVCAAKTFGKKCFVCEWHNRHPLKMDATEAEKKVHTKFYPQHRQLWNLRVEGQVDKGCQIFDQPLKKGFGEGVFTKINSAKADRKAKFDNFADADAGMSIRITPTSESYGEGSYVSCKTVEFAERESEVGDEWVAKAHCLDDMVTVPDYEKVKDMMLAGGSEKEDEDEDDGAAGELPEAPCAKGDTIQFKHKGKTLTGKATKVDPEEALVTVAVKGKEAPLKIDFDAVIPNKEEEEDDEDEDSELAGGAGGEEGDEQGDEGDVGGEEDDEEGELADEDDEEADDEEGDEEPEPVKGDAVTWVSEKSGKTLTGRVTSTPKNGACLVEYSKTKPAVLVKLELLSVVGGEDPDEDDAPIKTLRGGKTPPKPAAKPKPGKRRVIEGDDF